MTTHDVPNHSFTSDKGNQVDVFNTKSVESNGTFQGFGRTVRTFAKVCGVEVEVEAGCSFRAPSAVRKAGF